MEEAACASHDDPTCGSPNSVKRSGAEALDICAAARSVLRAGVRAVDAAAIRHLGGTTEDQRARDRAGRG